jgi:hypothetical protein
MSVVIPIFTSDIDIVIDNEAYDNRRKFARLMDEAELDLVSPMTIEVKSRLVYVYKELANVYLISNGSWDLVGVFCETHNLPSLSFSIKRMLSFLDSKFKNDLVFRSLTRKHRQSLLVHSQRNV